MPVYRVPRVVLNQNKTDEPFQQDELVVQHYDPGGSPYNIPTLREVHLAGPPMDTEQPTLHIRPLTPRQGPPV